MERFLEISGGVVTNVVRASAEHALAVGLVPYPDPAILGAVSIGWGFDGERFTPPPEPPVTPDMVKAEAARLILAICPEWRQRNLLAQAVNLQAKGRENWTEAEAAAWASGSMLWGQIAAVRAASDALEALTPIPQDYEARLADMAGI